MPGQYTCDDGGCGKGFQREGALTNHKNKCEAWKQAQRLLINQCIETSKLANGQNRGNLQRRQQKREMNRIKAAVKFAHSRRSHNEGVSSRELDEDDRWAHQKMKRKRRRVDTNFDVEEVVEESSVAVYAAQHDKDASELEFEAFDEGLDGQEGVGDFGVDEVEDEVEVPPASHLATPDPDQDDRDDNPEENDNIPQQYIQPGVFADIVAGEQGPLDDSTLDPPAETRPRRLLLAVCKAFRTAANSFGVFREYVSNPGGNSTSNLSSNLGQSTKDDETPDGVSSNLAKDLGPFKSFSEFLLEYHHWMFGDKTTNRSRAALVDMINSPHFHASSLLGVNFTALDDTLGDKPSKATQINEKQLKEEGWTQSDVEIAVPFKGRKTYDPYHENSANNALPRNNMFKTSNLWTRSISHLLREQARTQSHTRQWQWIPYKEYWIRPNDPNSNPKRLYGEIAASDEFLKAHQEVQRIRMPGCTLPKAAVPLMIWSDSTHLGSFTEASLHPVYIGFGNESKYVRGEPSSRACHQVAFLPKLNETLHEFLVQLGVAKGADSKLLSHCRRELMHAVWMKLLDDDFIEGYQNGWVVMCEDGIERRLFPRIFTYSADYPEKVMLACIRDMGDRPCPRCYTLKKDLDGTGTYQDTSSRKTGIRIFSDSIMKLVKRARAALYSGSTLAAKAVDSVLKPYSLVPTISAFANQLGRFGLDHYKMLVIDFMHEFELGVWRAIVHHIVRILFAHGEEYVREFDRRLRATPTFGADTIRRMRSNVSQFKKFAARDYEDLLQVIIPAIEGLLPEPDNTILMSLLSVLATYLSLGKLRLHTDDTLAYWELVIRVLGDLIRQFRDELCPRYQTKETGREAQARVRRALDSNAPSITSSRRPKQLNINTYKFHAMGDGPSTVRLFGTTDSYSTWIGELLHKRPKSQYARTAKNKSSTAAVTQIDRRQEELIRFAFKNEDKLPHTFLPTLRNAPRPKIVEEFPLENHHQVAVSQNNSFVLAEWLFAWRKKEPVATQHFRDKLKNHLISRLCNEQASELFPDFPRNRHESTIIQSDKIYEHQKLRIHFTTYDVRRGTDIINLKSGKQDVVIASLNPTRPFTYARVVGIYHVNARYNNGATSRVELLWVRWYEEVATPNPAPSPVALGTIQFQSQATVQFGFLDPSHVVRACHLIPAWHYGIIPDGQQLTQEFISSVKTPDYRIYYINRFVDRDMFMRYLGGGVGHAAGGAIPTFQGGTDLSWKECGSGETPAVPHGAAGLEGLDESAASDEILGEEEEMEDLEQTSSILEKDLESEGMEESDDEEMTASDYDPAADSDADDNDFEYSLD